MIKMIQNDILSFFQKKGQHDKCANMFKNAVYGIISDYIDTKIIAFTKSKTEEGNNNLIKDLLKNDEKDKQIMN